MSERRYCINCGVILQGRETAERICRVCLEHGYEQDDAAGDDASESEE